MRKSSKRTRSLEVINANAAGIDIGSQVHYVAVPSDRGARAIESFGCVTSELERMARWLKACGIETVAMESTGVYWISVCAVLEDHGFEVVLVDARQVKNTMGRKTDVQDSAWIQSLHSFGLLRSAFRPGPEFQIIRDYWRQRSSLVKDAARQIHLMHKSLDQMNVQIHKAVSDVAGVTGMRILRAIAAGVQDPETLVKLVTTKIKASPEEVIEALRGHYREQHVFALGQALKSFDFIHERIREYDLAIEKAMKRLPSRSSAVRVKATSVRRKNQPHFDLAQEQARITGVDLTRIDGVSSLTIQTVISESSLDLSAFHSEHHYSSWLGLAPNNKKTGGRVFLSRTRRVPSAAATALRIAAQALQKSKSALGDRYRQLRARIGTPKAITATAHLLAKLIYRGLTRGQEYLEAGLSALQAAAQTNKILALQKRAAYLGYQIVPNH